MYQNGHEGASKLQVITYGASTTYPGVTMFGLSRAVIMHLCRKISNLLIKVFSYEPTCAYVNDTVECKVKDIHDLRIIMGVLCGNYDIPAGTCSSVILRERQSSGGSSRLI